MTGDFLVSPQRSNPVHCVVVWANCLFLLGHTVLGCCWHHDHDCGAPPVGHDSTAARQASCCDHSRHGHSCSSHAANSSHAGSYAPCSSYARGHDESAPDEAPRGHSHGCKSGRCVTVLETRPPPPALAKTVCDIASPSEPHGGDVGRQALAVPSPRAHAPPQRRHLLHQILLI